MKNPQFSNKSDKRKIVFILISCPIIVAIISSVILAFLFSLIKNGFQNEVSFKTWFSYWWFKDNWIITGIISLLTEIYVFWFLIKRHLFSFRSAVNATERADSDVHDNAKLMASQEITDEYGDFSETYKKEVIRRDEKDRPYKETINAAKYDYNWKHLNKFEGVVLRSYKQGSELYVSGVKKVNTLICGTTGTGKTQYLISPTIEANAKSDTKASMIITDIKGDLFKKHSAMLKEQGYNTIVLNLRDISYSSRLNPFDVIYNSYHKHLATKTTDPALSFKLYQDCENYVKDITKMIIPDATGEQASWTTGAQSILGAVIFGMLEDSAKLGVEFDEKEPISEEELNRCKNEKERDFKLLQRIIAKEENVEDENYGSKKIKPDIQPIASKENLHYERYGYAFSKDMFNIAQISNIVNKQRDHLFDFIEHRRDVQTSKVAEFGSTLIESKDSPKTLSSYMSTFSTSMTTFMDEGIKYLTSKSDFRIESIIEQPTALFLVIPDESDSRYALGSLYIRQIYNYLIKYASNNPIEKEETFLEPIKNEKGEPIFDKKGFMKTTQIKKRVEYNELPRPVYFLCDEFANMPAIKEMPKNLSICRSRNIFFVLVIQELAQLEKVYGEKESEIMLANLPMQIYLGAELLKTVKYFQELMGKYTIYQRNASINKDTFNDIYSGTTSLQTKDLLTQSELQNIPQGTMFFKELRKPAAKGVLLPHFDGELRARGFFQDGSIKSKMNLDTTPIPYYDIMTREKIYNKKLEGENNSIHRLKPDTKLYKENERSLVIPDEPVETIEKQNVEINNQNQIEEEKQKIIIDNQNQALSNEPSLDNNLDEEEFFVVNSGVEISEITAVQTENINDFTEQSFEMDEFIEEPDNDFSMQETEILASQTTTNEFESDDIMAQMFNDAYNCKLDIEVKVNDQ